MKSMSAGRRFSFTQRFQDLLVGLAIGRSNIVNKPFVAGGLSGNVLFGALSFHRVVSKMEHKEQQEEAVHT